MNRCGVCRAEVVPGFPWCAACGEPLGAEAMVTQTFDAIAFENATTLAREFTRAMTVGRCLEKATDLPGAIAVFESIVAQDLAFSAPYQRLAILYRRMHKPNDEERVVRLALGRLSAHTTPWFTLRLAGILARQRKKSASQ